ncbi:MAG: hypothetical protein NXH91_08940 [Phyllobacteriaceae bacterium]|nr:hypothetical protein [Phyllobacteriaceae bacterium]
MDISRNAKKPETAARCGDVPRVCLGCKDCQGPCLLFAELYGGLAVEGPRPGSAA